MNKAFTKETDQEEEPDDDKASESLFNSVKNYVTPTGFSQMQDEYRRLLNDERPKVVAVIQWASGNGDRSENGDYIYSKKRLREIDRRVRYLTKRLESAQVIDPHLQKNLTQVFFGATVTYQQSNGDKQTITIVGIDEADLAKGKISWISPIAKALLKSEVGDTVHVETPSGKTTLTILAIKY